ncbi:MAG: hypothetical protein C0596_06925 [Marinilabiliales bacterium]|nr:MAG: hypothetical protein C0596_06925 [Marinilabiliales bacterium]
MKSKTTLRSVMVWLTIIGLSLIITNNSVFLHVHKLENGKIISHAHPFNKTEKSPNGAAKHKHSQQELYIYHILNNVLILGLSLIIIGKIYRSKNNIKRYYYNYFHSSFYNLTLKVRPPPTV